VIWLVPAVVAFGERRIAEFELVSVTVKLPWFGAPSVKLVLSCRPLPTVSAPTEMAGVALVTDRVACVVAMNPGIVALTDVEPNPASGWNATPPLVVSNGV
jgi:hypothetical protein